MFAFFGFSLIILFFGAVSAAVVSGN